jgi:hypothetical protein
LKVLVKWTLTVVTGIAVLVLVLLVLAVADGILQQRSSAAYFEVQAPFAATDTTDLGLMPTELVESSGLAISRAHPGVIWSHNDSGDGPVVYQMDTTAVLTATYTVTPATAYDWESMDLGVCPEIAGSETPSDSSPEWCLYLADVGDNNRRRDMVTIYIVAEPDPATEATQLTTLAQIRLGYSGNSYDVEAFAVTPEGGLVVVTKGRAPEIRVFHVSPQDVVSAVENDEVVQLLEGPRLPIEPKWDVGRVTTGASMSPDGSTLAVRTYSEIYFYHWPIEGEPEAAAPACFVGGLEPQGEAVAFWTGGRIMTTSESPGARPGHLLALRCQGVEG